MKHTTKSKTKKLPPRFIVFIVIIALVVGLVIWLAVSSIASQTVAGVRGNTVGNNGNYGLSVETPEGIFFANDGILLYSEDGETSLISEDQAMYLNYCDGFLYYSNVGEHGSLYRIRTDGSDREKLNDLRTESIEILNGTVYFATTLLGGETDTSAVGIYSYSPESGEIKLLMNQHAEHITCLGNTFLFTDRDNGYALVQTHTNGSFRRVLEEDFVYAYDIYDNYIYYATRDAIYRMKTDGSGKTKLEDSGATSLLVIDGKVYYVMLDSLSDEPSGTLMMLDNTGFSRTRSTASFLAINSMEEGYLLGTLYSVQMSTIRLDLETGEAEMLASGSSIAQ